MPQGGTPIQSPATLSGLGVTEGQEKALKTAQPDEATIIIKALIQRLRAISEKEKPPETQQPQIPAR
jgi:hypothetical protein